MPMEHAVETAPAADFTRLIADWSEIQELRALGEFYDLTGFELSPVVYDPR